MNPIAFELFGIQVAWYGILISLGIILGVILATKRAVAVGLHEETVVDMCLLAIPAAILGARAYYVIFKWDYYSQNLSDIYRFRQGGLAIHGGIIAGVVVGYLFCKKKKISFLKLADVCAPSIILGQAVGRWGNYFNQEAYGRATELPWAIEIDGMMVHPTFLYESLWNFAVFFFLLYFTKKKKADGQLFLLYLILYSVGRFFIEGLRTDSLMIGPLRVAQVISIVLIIVSMAFYYTLQKKPNSNKK
ncbi:prolipoprotein diacylglyceryl transferase [Serpentinicella sp. ANB-PHB4]|uniref:prolipoprotein diacylglyceryl transferase n=1 Tax=Serpentinicella sp. ANB-PHB4 TaxID=3074076 RepID=UPI002857F1BC|nr:prolipoprotein diacylglyceryl transferase [Serpentinicella sp. ANB-PHB4]MDR5658021.1 prolipoprotein diacylglyceryl transferase [Serpentinicella sp. ANB-PHB4]